MYIFNETQRFTQWFIWLLIAAILLLLGYCCYQWYVLGVSVDSVSPNDIGEQLLVIVCLLAVPVLFFFLRLNTQIDEKGIHYQFVPFHFSRKTISWSDIKECHVRQYSPITAYGGWGYRLSTRNGKAYSVSGKKGIQMELITGDKILIGTQKEVGAQQVINRYRKSEGKKNEGVPSE